MTLLQIPLTGCPKAERRFTCREGMRFNAAPAGLERFLPVLPFHLFPTLSTPTQVMGQSALHFNFFWIHLYRCMTGSHCHAAVWLWQAVAREGQRTAVLPVARALPLLMLAQKIQEMSRQAMQLLHIARQSQDKPDFNADFVICTQPWQRIYKKSMWKTLPYK